LDEELAVDSASIALDIDMSSPARASRRGAISVLELLAWPQRNDRNAGVCGISARTPRPPPSRLMRLLEAKLSDILRIGAVIALGA